MIGQVPVDAHGLGWVMNVSSPVLPAGLWLVLWEATHRAPSSGA
jgi:hypothetical protein